MNEHPPDHQRHGKRYTSRFFLTYRMNSGATVCDASQLHDISEGGLSFTTTHEVPTGTVLHMQIKTPLFTTDLPLKGTVRECRTIISDKIYEIHLELERMEPDIQSAFTTLIQAFEKIEHRKFRRIKKSFLVTFKSLEHPDTHYAVTQLKDISVGGLCLLAPVGFSAGTILELQIRSPLLKDLKYMEGTVVASEEKIKDMIYDTHIEFSPLTTEEIQLLEQAIYPDPHEQRKNTP